MLNKIPIVLVAPNHHGNITVRILHAILEKMEGVIPHTIFYKHIRFADYVLPTAKEEQLFIQLIGDLKPRLVGIQVLATDVFLARHLTQLIKKLDPGIVLVWGGIHPTYDPEACITEADIICVGEGEEALVELVTCLRDNRSYDQVQNLWINKEGRVIKNPLRRLKQDLDSIPFPVFGRPSFYFIDDNRLTQRDWLLSQNFIMISTGRGCPFSCSYCHNGVLNELYRGLGPTVRRRSVDNVIQELKLHKELRKGRQVFFSFRDDNFLMDEAWVNEFLDKYPKEIGQPFAIQSRLETIEPKKLRELERAGLTHILFGVESASAQVREKVFNRHESGENNQGIVRLSQEMGDTKIKRCYYLIVDNPYETPNMLKEAIALFLQLPQPFEIFMFHLIYFPNTPILRQALKDNMISSKDAELDNIVRQTQRVWRYHPRVFPFTEKTHLQNILWLLGEYALTKQLDSKRRLFQAAVFERSLGALVGYYYLSFNAVILGKIYGRAGILKRYPWITESCQVIRNAIELMSKGQWQTLRVKARGYLRAKDEERRSRPSTQVRSCPVIRELDLNLIQKKAQAAAMALGQQKEKAGTGNLEPVELNEINKARGIPLECI